MERQSVPTGTVSGMISTQPSCPVTPAGWQILVRLKPFEEKTKTGIFIPKSHGELHNRAALFGEVIARGPDSFRQKITGDDKWIKPSCQPGDWIMFESYTGTPFKYDGVEYRLMPDECVLGTVDASRISELERV